MGIKLWFAPQSSLHCPNKTPEWVNLRVVRFSRPGVASIFVSITGRVKEWITSSLPIRSRVSVPRGRAARLSASSNRVSPKPRSSEGHIKLSNSTSSKSPYSYLQYHWCPVTLREIEISPSSSWEYRIIILGIATVRRIRVGTRVHKISWYAIAFSCRKNLPLKNLIIIIRTTPTATKNIWEIVQ